MQNTSLRNIETLYDFMKSAGIPLTDDGCFLAYKFVGNDYKDCYSRTIDNSVGSVVKMDRNKVDDDPNRTCSRGLHVGNFEYSGSPSGDRRVVICKVHPKDVVAIPVDYDAAKMRVCEYEVVGEVEKSTKMVSTVATPVNSSFLSSEDYLDDGEYGEY